ncbi:Ig domain-containing protein [Gracilimonas sp. BCB1]|uniref:Ig domain-containing protein n=1 Tax=Gracilimonas sp. BCB1 TaxID=3152362 RepID=UPI0032D948F8
MKFISRITLILTFLFICTTQAMGQQQLVQDYARMMEIPDVKAMEASPSHLYVLSESEGMAVFRSYPDSLQWLYTSSGMQRRGNTIIADIRFAYLFGDSRRLTVLEPTSVLGVYSSTILPVQPKAAARLNNSLYIAMGNEGLGRVSLESPESVDTAPEIVAQSLVDGASVIDLRSSNVSNQLFVLTAAPSLLVFNQQDSTLLNSANISLRRPLDHIFVDQESVWGSTATGEIFEIRSTGIGKKIGVTNESVDHISRWNERLFVRTVSGRVWTTDESGLLGLWKDDTNAGNYLANSANRIWISENDNVSEIMMRTQSSTTSTSAPGEFSIKPIPNQVITYPNPLIQAFEMEGNYPTDQVEFSYRSNAQNAKIRKQGFFWQPTINQVGNFWFSIVATNSEGQSDSTRFVVDVRSFNAPPRFSPVRSTSIAVNEEYIIQFNATDPESPQNSLVRYIGVDMPDGATINEKTGEFSWTPTERQVGESTFKVIATDRLGAASSIDVTLNVLDISRGGE